MSEDMFEVPGSRLRELSDTIAEQTETIARLTQAMREADAVIGVSEWSIERNTQLGKAVHILRAALAEQPAPEPDMRDETIARLRSVLAEWEALYHRTQDIWRERTAAIIAASRKALAEQPSRYTEPAHADDCAVCAALAEQPS
jgi:uncharacterized coiled-coil protein SlyX